MPKPKSVKYAIKLVRLDPATGAEIIGMAAGTDDLDKFNETDLMPFIEEFKKRNEELDQQVKKIKKQRARHAI